MVFQQSMQRVVWLVLLLCLASCISSGDDDKIIIQQKQPTKKIVGLGLPHPRAHSAWETDVLLVSNELPDSKELQDCHRESKELSQDTLNEVAILQAKTAMLEMVNQRPEVYHWCFYYVARHLDRQLDRVGLPWAQKNDTFLSLMREMWVMARALEESTKDPRYYRYLNHRYITMSKEIFGRHLEMVAPPIDHSPEPPPSTKKPGKAAGELDEGEDEDE